MSDPIRPTDTQLYLARVAGRLDLAPDLRGEVVEELAAHVADAVAALGAEGLAREQAEREALARLGSPEALGDELLKAQQTPRRLAFAVAQGTSWFVRTGLFWTLSSFLALFVVTIVASVVVQVLAPSLDGSAPWPGTTDSIAPFSVGLVLGAFFGAREAVLIVARGARRPASLIGRWGAVIGTPLVAAWSTTLFSAALDGLAVAMLLLVPVAFAAGCLAGPRVHWPARPLRWGALGLVAAVVLVVIASAGGPRVRTFGSPPISDDMGFERVAAAVPAGTEPLFDFGGTSSRNEATVEFWWAPSSALRGWRDIRVEAWRGSVVGSQGIAADARGPYVRVAPSLDDGTVRASIRVGGDPRVTHWWVVLTGVDDAGRRVRLAPPVSGWTTFQGTVLEWFQGMAAPGG